MSNILMVPIHLDALLLIHDRSVLEAMADFSRLPYFDGQLDVNPDVANVSEEILSQPFQDRGFYLKAGAGVFFAYLRWHGPVRPWLVLTVKKSFNRAPRVSKVKALFWGTKPKAPLEN